MLEQSLNRAGVAARSLAIEITETSTARYKIARETILSLRKMGHSVHIDDFGTGYSSLSYLHDLSVDAIKIDKSFTQAVGTDSVILAILPQILSMAAALNLDVIVEGVETAEQARYFAASPRAILAQGWRFGRPCWPSSSIGYWPNARLRRCFCFQQAIFPETSWMSSLGTLRWRCVLAGTGSGRRLFLSISYVITGVARGTSRNKLLGNRMKKPADKKSLRYLPGVCRLFRGNAHNQFMASTAPQILCRLNPPVCTGDDLPHPSPAFLPCA